MILRPYQERAIEQLRQNMREGCKSQVLCAPTGAGKTLLSAHLIREVYNKGKRAVMVADRVVLVRQTSAVLFEQEIDHGIIMADDPGWAPHRRVQVASVQTLARRKWPEADLIIVDEGHSMVRTVLHKIALRDAYTIALTATPTTKGMGRHYERVVNVTTTHELIKDGFLVPYRIYAASEPDMSGVKVVGGEFEERETERRVMPIVGDVVAEYVSRAAGRKAIGFGVNVAHCRELQRQFMAAGIIAELYTYKEGDEQRIAVMDEFRKPDSYIRVLLSVSALSRGVDVPDIGCVILARPLRSSVAELVQSIGRGLRTAEGKSECIILDHGGSTVRMWSKMMDLYDNGVRELDDGRPKEKVKAKEQEREPHKCPRCAAVHAPLPLCPSCGFQYPPRKANIEHVAGDLREVGGHATDEQRREFHAMLLHVAQQRGKATGWAAHVYKQKYGGWPKGTPEPKEPTPEVLSYVRYSMIRYAKGKAKAQRR